MTTSSNQNPPPIHSRIPGRFTFEPLPEGDSPVLLLEALLKYPGRIVHELQFNWKIALSGWLLMFALIGMSLYGLVVGSFSGGPQMWIAPAKLVLGTLLSVLICLPSLYIFACLGGIDARLRAVTGVFFAAVGLSSLLLIGFAPVAWIFSQSTDSIAFMGALHLGLWAIGTLFGLRLIEAMGWLLTGSARSHLKLWGMIFGVVCLQMMTTLRPIVGTSKTFFPTEKKFFLAHWFETFSGPSVEKKKIGTSGPAD
jgi:hypothetical protein